MNTIVSCPACKREYDLNEETGYIEADGRCGKCHVTDHMLKAFRNGITIDGVKMCGKKIDNGS